MDCPNCGYPRAKYDVSRKVLWGGHRTESSSIRKTSARTNFNAYCPKCGYKWDDKLEDYVPTEEEQTEADAMQAELEEAEADMEDEEE